MAQRVITLFALSAVCAMAAPALPLHAATELNTAAQAENIPAPAKAAAPIL